MANKQSYSPLKHFPIFQSPFLGKPVQSALNLPFRSDTSNAGRKNFSQEFLGKRVVDHTRELFKFAYRPATRQTATSVQRQFLDFQVAQKLMSREDILNGLLPTSVLSQLLFIGWLDLRDLTPGSIDTYNSAINTLYANNGRELPERQQLVLLLRKALRRKRIAEGRLSPKRHRRPLTPSLILSKIQPYIAARPQDLELQRLYTMILLGVFGIMRSGELTVHPTLEQYSPFLHINRSGYKLHPEYAEITLPVSKTSQEHATTITVPFLPASMAAICPYRALVQWLNLTETEDRNSHLLSLNNKPYTKSNFKHLFKQTLRRCGLNETEFSGHSLRIGGLTALREAGIDESEAMIIGRWTSTVNRIYGTSHARVAATLCTYILQNGLPSNSPPTFELSLQQLHSLNTGTSETN